MELLETRALLATSALDRGFGQAGLILGPVNQAYTGATEQVAAAVQPNGKIVEVDTRYVASGSGPSPIVVRQFNANGSVDTAFGTNGQTEVPLPSYFDSVYALPRNIILQNDGGIVLAAGVATTQTPPTGSPQNESIVARLTATGQMDSTFRTGGEVVLPSTVTTTNALAADGNGRILVAGSQLKSSTGLESNPLAIVRLTTTGALDTSFNGTGEVTIVPPDSSGTVNTASTIYQAAGIGVNSAGQIYVASNGFYYIGFGYTRLDQLIRVNTGGTLDTSFGSGGSQNLAFSNIHDMTIQADDKILLVGDRDGLGGTQALIRVLANGQADPNFTPLITPEPYQRRLQQSFNRVIETTDDKILVAGAGTYNRLFVERFNADGTIDTSFGLRGLVQFAVASTVVSASSFLDAGTNSLAVTPGGNIILAGRLGMTNDPTSRVASQSVLAQVLPITLKPTTDDYDGDGVDDIAAELTSLGQFAYRKSTGGDVIQAFGPVGAVATIPAPGDYDGDGKTDVAAYLPALAVLAYRPSSGGPDLLIPFGQAGVGASIPAPGDYDGDGRTDVAAYIPSLGELFYRPSSGGPDVGILFGTPGPNGSIPAPGDYDGDGITDVAVYLPASGQLAYRTSTGRFLDEFVRFGQAGVGTTVPAPGDYDGDGKTDVAAYLPALGLYAYRPSSGGPDVLRSFGTAGTAGQSIPAPGDYDGDGRTDVAVYLPYSALFAFHSSQNGNDVIQSFGAAGARQTVPAASIPYAQPTTGAGSNASSSGQAAAAVYIPLTDDLMPATRPKAKVVGG